jgi:hypothetical protein
MVAIALTTNVGWSISTTHHIALDQDVLWNLSYPVAHSAIFTDFTGTLDGNGMTASPFCFIPSLPSLISLPLCAQAIVVGAGVPRLTNALSSNIH